MRRLVLCVAARSICCVNARPTEARAPARAAPDPVATSPTTTAVQTAAEYAITAYVDESTRKHGVVCLDLEGTDDPAALPGRLAPLASRLSVDRKDCLGHDEPSAILSIGP